MRRPPHLSILSAFLANTINNFQYGHVENNIGYPQDVVWRIGIFLKIHQYFQYLKQNDRLRIMTQSVKEAGFYVFDDDPVKEDHRLFFKFLSYSPQVLNQNRLLIFQHHRSRYFLKSFQAHFSYPNVLCVHHGKLVLFPQE